MRGLLLGHGRQARMGDRGAKRTNGNREGSRKGLMYWPWMAVNSVSRAPGTLDGYAEIWRRWHVEGWWGFVGKFLDGHCMLP